MCGNRVEFLWAFFGACWLGAAPAPLNTNLRGGMLRHQLDDLAATAIVFENSTAAAVRACFREAPGGLLLNVDTSEPVASLRAGTALAPPRRCSAHRAAPTWP